MTYHGRVKKGVIVLDEPNALPEGAEVQVVPLNRDHPTSILERMKDVVGIAEGLPADLAEQHDHYVHGAPKKS